MMNKRSLITVLTGFCVFFITSAVYAGKPLWTFTPIPGYPPTITISPSENATIQYTVTNQSKRTLQLVTSPIQGITTTGCAFPLGSYQSCTLILQVNGSALSQSIFGGPRLCVQGNPLQCYQPSQENQLRIKLTNTPPVVTYTIIPSGNGHETITPATPQTVNSGETQQFTVIADIGYALNTNVGGTCPAGSWSGSVYTTGAITANCSVIFSSTLQSFTVSASGDAQVTPNPISQNVNYNSTGVVNLTVDPDYTAAIASDSCGGNLMGTVYTTGAVTANCAVNFSSTINPTTISVNGSPLLLPLNTTGSLTVTNTGSVTAINVMATLPAGLAANVTQDASQCSSLAPGASCYLHFASNNQPYPATAITIAGTNTNTVSASIALDLPYVTNGVVNSLAFDSVNNVIYLGGNFSYVGPNTGGGVLIDDTTGIHDPAYARVNGSVAAVAPDGSGGWYIGGSFTNVDGVDRNRVAHILNDGSLDPTWNPNANNSVISLTVNGSTVYAGGNFTSIGGLTRNRIAALDATTGVASSWDPNANNTVFTIKISGSTVYAGGSFTTIGGQTRNRLAALDSSTGLATGWNPNVNNGYVAALLLNGSNIYVGGSFLGVSGQARVNIAEVNTTTGIPTAWAPNANNVVNAIGIIGNTVYAGGTFTAIGGQTRNLTGAVDATTGLATGWNPSPSGGSSVVNMLVTSGSTVYVGGTFVIIGGQLRNNIAAIDSSTGVATSWNPNANNNVTTLALNGSNVYMGGSFSSVGGQLRRGIAALNASTGVVTNWNPDANGAINAMLVNGSIIYAGGSFTSIGGQSRNRIATLDTTTGLATAWNPNATGIVNALGISGSTVYAAGAFGSIGGQTRNRIAALSATTGLASGWNPNANNIINSLWVSGSTIYAGGTFTTVGGQTRNRIAALDAATGLATAWNPNANNTVNSLLVNGSTIYAGGAFTTIDGQTRNRIAALDATTGLATIWDANANGIVNTLAIFGGYIYAGGQFSSIGGLARNYIAALDTSTALATSWNPNANNSVLAIALSSSTVYAGGNFSAIGELATNNIAVILMDLTP